MKFAFILLALPSIASASVSLSSSETPLKTCMIEQIRSGTRADSVEFVNAQALPQFPAYAQATVIANSSNPKQREAYTVLLKTSDFSGWSLVENAGEMVVSAVSVEPDAEVRNSIGKDVIVLNLANCAL